MFSSFLMVFLLSAKGHLKPSPSLYGRDGLGHLLSTCFTCRHIVPPEIPDGQEGEHHRIDDSGEQEGREVQPIFGLLARIPMQRRE